VVFTTINVTSWIILQGLQTPITTLCNSTSSCHFNKNASAATSSTTPANLVAFVHAALFILALFSLEETLQ